MGRTHKTFGFRTFQKPNKIKGSGDWRFHIAHMKRGPIVSIRQELLSELLEEYLKARKGRDCMSRPSVVYCPCLTVSRYPFTSPVRTSSA
jgi:hypothetical protein